MLAGISPQRNMKLKLSLPSRGSFPLFFLPFTIVLVFSHIVIRYAIQLAHPCSPRFVRVVDSFH
jgi:hypothetical protein